MFSFQGTNFLNRIASVDVVGSRRLELPTSRLSGVRSNHLSYEPICGRITGRSVLHPTPFLLLFRSYGGDEENRTPDPLLARQVLSQLSYTPIFSIRFFRFPIFTFRGSYPLN